MYKPTYLRESEPIPPCSHVREFVDVPSITLGSIKKVQPDAPMEITRFTDTFRQYLPSGGATITMEDGSKQYIPSDLIQFSLHGGGRYAVVFLNPLYDRPLTRKEARREAREYRENYEAYDY
jgi:hypothetical protein